MLRRDAKLITVLEHRTSLDKCSPRRWRAEGDAKHVLLNKLLADPGGTVTGVWS